jgi:hypothetical protein
MAGREQARAVARAARAAATARGNYGPGSAGAAAVARAKGKAQPQQSRVSAETTARANAFLSREALLDDAINQGVIDGSLRAHYATCYDRDPGGTQTYLQSLGLRSTATASASSEVYVEANLSTAERTRIAAAREGRQPARIVNGGL